VPSIVTSMFGVASTTAAVAALVLGIVAPLSLLLIGLRADRPIAVEYPEDAVITLHPIEGLEFVEETVIALGSSTELANHLFRECWVVGTGSDTAASAPLTTALSVWPSCAVPLIDTLMLGVASMTAPVVALAVPVPPPLSATLSVCPSCAVPSIVTSMFGVASTTAAVAALVLGIVAPLSLLLIGLV
jgi:hypothetical protein